MRGARARDARPEHVLDGAHIDTLEAFCAAAARALLGDAEWRGDLDALGEALDAARGGGYGPLPTSCRLVWRDAGRSRAALGHAEAVRHLTARLRDCRPNVLIQTAWALRAARRGEGPTAYDRALAVLRRQPHVELVLR